MNSASTISRGWGGAGQMRAKLRLDVTPICPDSRNDDLLPSARAIPRSISRVRKLDPNSARLAVADREDDTGDLRVSSDFEVLPRQNIFREVCGFRGDTFPVFVNVRH